MRHPPLTKFELKVLRHFDGDDVSRAVAPGPAFDEARRELLKRRLIYRFEGKIHLTADGLTVLNRLDP